jgi:hypothetical protein
MKPYEEIVEDWVREYICTMDGGILRAGDDSGDFPTGVKIIFDGYGDLDTEDEYIEGGNHSMMSFAVFVHKTSLDDEFPEHEQTPWALVHRPREEVCIWVWYNEEDDSIEVIPFEERDCEWVDEVGEEAIYKLINDIWYRDNEDEMG